MTYKLAKGHQQVAGYRSYFTWFQATDTVPLYLFSSNVIPELSKAKKVVPPARLESNDRQQELNTKKILLLLIYFSVRNIEREQKVYFYN